MPQHIERAFEEAIEEHLLGHGWHKGDPDRFDRALALDPAEAARFVQETQPEAWTALANQHKERTGQEVVIALLKWIETKGLLETLRHGFKCYGKLLRIASFRRHAPVAERAAHRDGRAEEPAHAPERQPRHRAVRARPGSRLPVFQFKKRALVHFAVDPDVVYMATQLREKGAPRRVNPAAS